MHLESSLGKRRRENGTRGPARDGEHPRDSGRREAETYASEEELKAIFERTYGPV